jgi:hypothetical protein
MHPKRTMRPGRIPVTCHVCGALFGLDPSRFKPGISRFCGRPCRSVWQRSNRAPLAERFWPKIVKTDCCWLWVGYTKPGSHDYGSIGSGGKSGKVIKAHQASWLLHRGPIPDGLHVLHNCPGGDNPRCVNPGHLWLGTHLENMRDMWRKLRAGLIHRCCQSAA